MQFPTRALTRPEWDLMRAIQEAAFRKWSPILREADKAADEADKDAKRIQAEVKANPEYQQLSQLMHGPSGELGKHFKTLGNGDTGAGCLLFQKAMKDAEAPWHKADADTYDAGERHAQLKIEASDASDTALVLTFLRLGYRAGAQDTLNVATNPGSPADTLKFMRDVMDDGPATDTMIADTVDKILSSPAMAAVIGGEQ